MSKLVRFGVSLEKKLFQAFDRLICDKGYTNRSEAIRDLIRAELVQQEWRENERVVGAIMMVFDHHRRGLQTRITDLQHQYSSRIVATQHIHLDHHNCLEVAIVRGKAREIQKLAGRLKALRNIKHCSLSMSTTAREIP